jgi:triacylglycerol lipase
MTCQVRDSQVVARVVLCISVLAGCASVEDGASPPGGEDLVTTTEVADDETPGEDAAGQAALVGTSGYTATRHPIVLVHGMSGWKTLLGAVEYFHGIPGELRAGGARVYVTSVSAFSSSEARGEQLLGQVEYIAAAGGTGKVNLIGHSQGGLDARYVAAVRPEVVASLTTVGTPHEGARLADWLLDHTRDGGFTQTVFDTLGGALGLAIDLLAGTDHPQETLEALRQVSSAGMSAFNARYPLGLPTTYCGSGPEAERGIRFYSWTGTSVLTHLLDPTDAPFAVTSLFSGRDNDGLVDRCSARFGRTIRDDYRMNHLDQVNQLFGLVSLFETSPKALFRAHANRLKHAGL